MAEKKSRAPGQRKSFGIQKTTPTGGVIRKGVRGEGADQREVEKRLEFTPGQTHWAEYETCDQEDCSSSKPCKQCAKFTKKNIKNARAAKRRPRMDEEELQEKNKKRRQFGQRKSFGVQETTPTGGVIRKGVRGEGADQRNVEKRLKFTPGQAHRAEYETCDQEDCSSSNPCKQCAKFTKQNIKNARTAKSLPGQSKNDREAKR